MSTYRIRVRPEIYTLYLVEADNEKQAKEKFLNDEAKYQGQDTSDDHLSVAEKNIVNIEEVW